MPALRAVARKQQAKFWKLRLRPVARPRQAPEARELLASIYGWFTEVLDTPILKEAKALVHR
jgi:hypothetical protein